VSNRRAYQLYAHITWHTWKRVGCLDSLARADIMEATRHACNRCRVHLLRAAVLADHVHLLVSYRPNTCLSEFVRLAKGVAARRANRRVPGAVRWGKGYYVASLSKSHLRSVSLYIARQFDRHPDRIPKVRSASSGTQSNPRREPGDTGTVGTPI